MRIPRRGTLTTFGLALLCAIVFGAWSPGARGLVQPSPLPPVPPLPPPPVQVPTVPQLPTVPRPPAVPPSLPRTAVATPRPPATPPATAAAPLAGPAGATGGGISSSGGSSQGYTGSASEPAASSERRPSRTVRVASSREWISTSGPRGRRKTTLTFVLSKPSVVEFVLLRVAPDCRSVGRFRVKGRAGANRVRFRGRINGRTLRPGTYLIRAHALPARGKALTETKLVIFKRRPLPGELAAAQASNTCGGSDGTGDSTSASSAIGAFGSPGEGGKLQVRLGDEGSGPIRLGRKGKTPTGVLGVRFTRAADAVKEVPALLFVLLGIAIGLLAAAAMPLRFVPNARMAAVLAYRRTFVALVGAITLGSVAVVYALA